MPSKQPKQASENLRRRLLTSGGWAFLGKLLALICFVLSYSLICNRYEESQAAAYLLLQSLAILGALLANWGLGPVIIYRIRQARHQQLDGDVDAVWRQTLKAAAIVSGFTLVASVAAMVLMAWLPGLLKVDLSPYALFLVFWIILLAASQLFGEILRAAEKFFAANCLSGGHQSGMLTNIAFFSLIVFLPRTADFTIVLTMQIVALLVAVTYGAIRIVGLTRHGTSRGVALSQVAQPIGLAREGAPIVISQLTVIGLLQFEAILVGVFANDPGEIAAYGAIRRMMSVVAAPLLLVNASLPTFIVDLYSRKQTKKLERLLRGSTTLAMLPAMVILALVIGFPKFFLAQFDPGFEVYALALQIMAIGQIIFVLAGSSGLALRMTGFQKIGMVSAICSMIIYLASAPWMIAGWGILGAAVANCMIVCIRNFAGIALVKHFVGIWTTPKISLLHPDVVRTLLLRRGNKTS